ncbi:error-prone DNA polymerase [Actinocatenispora comari]|uniref:error-prone DNA polymerase n=1 Tax=Actinocatenispora comari TaxID=2807577 RepID=UPI001A93353A
MGWHNPPISWAEYRRRLVGGRSPDDPEPSGDRKPADDPEPSGDVEPSGDRHPAHGRKPVGGPQPSADLESPEGTRPSGGLGSPGAGGEAGGERYGTEPVGGGRTRRRDRRLRALPGAGTDRYDVDRPGAVRAGGDRNGTNGGRAAVPPGAFRRAGRVRPVPYAELHCHTNYSFLDGASPPGQLAEQAARLGLAGLAVTDHDGFYGVVDFAEAARDHGLATVFGAELTLAAAPVASGPNQDPAGEHLLVLARGAEGYRRLATAISEAHLRGGRKGRPVYDPAQLAELGRGHWWVLTGCRKGAVPAALAAAGPGAAMADGRDAAEARLRELVAMFGADRVAVELTDHDRPDDDDRNEILAELAQRQRLPVVATGNVHYARPADGRLAAALAAVRARCSLDELAGWLPPAGAAFLRSGAEMAARFRGWPGAVESTVDIAADCAFDLRLVAPRLPDFDLPADVDSEMAYLRRLTYDGAAEHYGSAAQHPGAYEQIEHELAIIDELGFPGYFLVVWDIVRFCREKGILCQGRGSAANSAVCYALGITAADPIAYDLLFERFLAPERDGPPDIDIDIASDRREEVIQYVYTKHGRRHAAQVANVISYRPRMAVRDAAAALGYSPGQRDAWSRSLDGHASTVDGEGIPGQVIELADRMLGFPRHLGIHSGGMVICDRPVSEVCPVEHARMPGRTVLQWDKEGCAAIELVKFDLLGLGMLTALGEALRLVGQHHGERYTLHELPIEDEGVYQMLCEADSVGVFQVESRAQMATLPRLKPKCFYDLVVEVALIRPGPIQGGSVHPYLDRKNGRQPKTIPHPLMERALGKTLGVPLFQEQLMQLAMDVADFGPAEADRLRRAMGSKRSTERMEQLRRRLYEGMAGNGITGELADEIFTKLSAFANFGFPESHAISFAFLVYASAYLKRYYPAAFCAALLNAQPMGFYSPQTLVADARRHGVAILRPDINSSGAGATLEGRQRTDPAAGRQRTDPATGRQRADPAAGRQCADPAAGRQCAAPAPKKAPKRQWGVAGPAVRLGLSAVRGVGTELAEKIVAERQERGPYRDLIDLARRTGLGTAALEALATAGAFGGIGLTRRQALWAAGAAATERPDTLPGTGSGAAAPTLPGMDAVERIAADVWAIGLSTDSHPAEFARDRLDAAGARRIGELAGVADGDRVTVGGVVTHRQRPSTAGGVTFVNLEDETGMLNVICSPGVWRAHRRTARTAPAMLVRGRLERADGVTNLVAERIAPLSLSVRTASRDFR